MSTTLRTLICSCQYLHEGDPRAALVLTHHVCTIPHTILPFPSNVESVVVDQYLGGGGGGGGSGKETRRKDLGGKAGKELLSVYFMNFP